MGTTTASVPPRRKLPTAPASLNTTEAAEAVSTPQEGTATAENGNEERPAITSTEADIGGNIDYLPKDLDMDAMHDFRMRVQDMQSDIAHRLRQFWHLPFSRETIYAFGEMSGHFAMLLSLIDRDISDNRQND